MSPLQLLAPPAHTCQLLTWELTSDQDLRTIRAGIHRLITADQSAGSADLAQRIGLVATELAGNALRHGLPPIVVQLLGDDDCYVLDVSDHAPQRAPQPVAASSERALAGGRGLHIARTLAQQLGWYKTETTKHVWALFPVPRARPESG